MMLKKSFFHMTIVFIMGGLFFLGTSSLQQKKPHLPDEVESLSDFCTVIMVGKEASADGSVMTTHAADCGVCDWTWHHVPAKDYQPGERRPIYRISQITTWPPYEGSKWELSQKNETGTSIPQVEHTYAYHHGVFGYMNEHQLAIGESTIGCRRELRNPTPSAVFDITTLTLLAMERCRTAREAIELMGSLAEKYGYGYHDGGEMLAVADAQEVWVFEIMPVGPLWTPESGHPGAVWCAQRVPDDHVSVCPNESRIGEIDLNNSDYFMASSNVISLAVEKGFYSPDSGEPFNWKKAYSPSAGSAASSGGARGRMWRFFDLVAPSRNFSPETPNMEFPFSVKPDRKLSVADVMELTRDKYKGTPYDPGQGLRGGPFQNPNYHPRPVKVEGKTYSMPRPIGVNRAEYTTITQCRNWLPAPIGGIIWLSFGAQGTSCYMPLYAGINQLPASFSIGDHWTFNRESARWAFDYVDFHVQVAYSHAIEDVREAREEWESEALERTAAIDEMAEELYQKAPEQVSPFLTDYCLSNARQVINAWWELGDFLLVKYNQLSICDPETRKRSNLPYPEWWLKEVIRFHKLEPIAEQ